jgi:mRNA interferase RelE/StbE
MAFHVYICPRAGRQIEALPQVARDRIRIKLLELVDNPRPPGCKTLEAYSDIYRIRVGDYRATYCIHDNRLMILVLRVANRREIYDRKDLQGMVKDAREWLAARKQDAKHDK